MMLLLLHKSPDIDVGRRRSCCQRVGTATRRHYVRRQRLTAAEKDERVASRELPRRCR